MASVLEGLIAPRRRASRSRSESGKQLHSRWGDVAITAPNAGWSQSLPHPPAAGQDYGHGYGSPDSQQTLVNHSHDLSYDPDKVDKLDTAHSTPPLVQRERSAIVITIPLPWARKTHRRSLSVGPRHVEDVHDNETVDERPASASASVEDSWPLVDPLRSSAPDVHAAPPLHDDDDDDNSSNRTVFTYAGLPEKSYGPGRLPQLQTGVPPAQSQPASAISILSPVAESFNGLSESNNVTPVGATPIAQVAIDGLSDLPATATATTNADQGVHARSLISRLDTYFPQTANSLPPSLVTSPVELLISESNLERTPAQSSAVISVSSRPQSRGLGIGGAGRMRSMSRNRNRDPDREPRRSESRGGTAAAVAAGGRGRSALRESSSDAESVEPIRPRTASRDAVAAGRTTPRAISRPCSRNTSREPAGRMERRAPVPLPQEAEPSPISVSATIHRSPSPDTIRITRRAHSREAYSSRSHPHHTTTPTTTTSTTYSPSWSSSLDRQTSPSLGSVTPRRISSQSYSSSSSSSSSGRRAASVDPILRWHTAGSRDDMTKAIRWSSPATRTSHTSASTSTSTSTSGSSLGTDASTSPIPFADDATDHEPGMEVEVETETEAETDEVYFQSRKGWNGPAGMKGAESKGFYADVVQDYKAIARDRDVSVSVEAATATATVTVPKRGMDPFPSTSFSVSNMVVNKKDGDKPRDRDRGRDGNRDGNKEREKEKVPRVYGGPDLVPSHEELWG